MYQQVFEASINSIIFTNPEGFIMEMNDAAEKMFGYSKEELVGKHIKELYFLNKDLEDVESQLKRTKSFKGAVVNKCKSGKIFNSYLSANEVKGDNGEVIGVMGISRDITDEITLENEYKQFVKTISDIVYVTNAEGLFTYTNQPVQTILGYSPKELIGTYFNDIIYQPHKEKVTKHYKSLLEKKISQDYLEFQVIKKDGCLVWVGQQVSTKFSTVIDGKVDGFYGVVRDIDKQKKTELLLAESEEKYRELFDSSSDLIQSIDVNGKFLYVNNSWKMAMGYSDLELKSINIFEIIHPDSRQHCTVLFEDIIKTADCNKGRILYDLVAKNGNIITVEGEINTKVSNSEVVSIQSFLRNVTEQKAAERLLAKQEKTLRQITETINDVFYLYNLEEKKYEYISSNCETILGADEAFFYAGKNHIQTYGLKSEIPILLEANKKVEAGEQSTVDYRLKVEGKTKWINEKSFPVFNELGEVIAISGICRDITDLKAAHATIYEQNLEINASILYAKRLQDSVLPTSKTMREVFPNSFIFYRPKDVVSGDFYVVDYLRTNDHEVMPTFIVGDCTGHGVPGALLSLMCNVLVRESFTQQNVNSPSEALDFVRGRLIKFFSSQGDQTIRDGMDVTFCVLNKKANQLYFSGANNPCLIIRDGEIIEYRGVKQHVGFDEDVKPFETHIIDVQKDDIVYLFSDGFMDQFGGVKMKKFTKRRFHNLLIETSSLPMNEVEKIMSEEFDNWKGNIEQLDDVTVMGIKI